MSEEKNPFVDGFTASSHRLAKAAKASFEKLNSSEMKEDNKESDQKIDKNPLPSPFSKELKEEDLPKEFDSWTKIYHWWCNNHGYCAKSGEVIYILVPIRGSGKHAFNMYPLEGVVCAMHKEREFYEKRKRGLGK